MAFGTPSIRDFLKYVIANKTGTELTQVDAQNPSKLFAKTTFDFGTNEEPLHKENTATLGLKPTAAYNRLLQTHDYQMSQKDASEWVEDWADHIQVLSRDGREMPIPAAAEAFRKMTIDSARSATSEVGDFGASASIAESIEAKNQDQLPAVIIFTCLPFLGFSEQSFNLRVTILTRDEPKIKLKIMQLEATQEAIAEEFVELIEDGLSDTKMPVYLSSF